MDHTAMRSFRPMTNVIKVGQKGLTGDVPFCPSCPKALSLMAIQLTYEAY